jgi:hypothetical protein
VEFGSLRIRGMNFSVSSRMQKIEFVDPWVN